MTNADAVTTEHVDVLIVGAGLSGIGAAVHLTKRCPSKSFVVLEGRSATGGTWDLFRYPGVRSDSDMYTLGYSFRPWRGDKAMADGPAILEYIRETAREYGVDRKIRLGHRVERVSWSSETQTWTADVRTDGKLLRFTASFVFACSGYYDYAAGYTPEFPGIERYRGRIVHPQRWTDDVDYEGQRVVVIGSGATAVTLVPELAKKAAHVTMLQRSPTYVLALPGRDRVARWLNAKIPGGAGGGIARWKNVARGSAFYAFCRRFPDQAKKLIASGARSGLGSAEVVEKHFTPRYSPWEQRLCVAPDGDFFEAIRTGRAEVVTDTIASFTETGLELDSGKRIDADIVVTATGLKLQLFGGAEVVVDGTRVSPGDTMMYKATLFEGVPNFAAAIGYANASWTLKSDLASEFVCRLLDLMDRKGYRTCTPRRDDQPMSEEPILPLASGYIQRAKGLLPRQGSKAPWRLTESYFTDVFALRHASLEDGVLEFR